MKQVIFSVLVFCLYTGVTFLHQVQIKEKQEYSVNPQDTSSAVKSTQRVQTASLPEYKLKVKYNSSLNRLQVTGTFSWVNKTRNQTSDLYLNCFPNAYSSPGSIYHKRKNEKADTLSGIKFTTLKVMGVNAVTENVHKLNSEKGDSSLLRIKLPSAVSPGDTVRGEYAYSFQLPQESLRSFSFGDDESIFAQWFPRVAVLADTGWAAYPHLPFAEFNLEHINLSFTVELPEGYQLLAPGVKQEQGKESPVSVNLSQIIDVPLCFVKKENTDTLTVSSGRGNVSVKYYAPENDKQTLKRVLNRSIAFLENVSGPYPGKELTLLPVTLKSSFVTGMEYSQFVIVPPAEKHIKEQTEAVIFHEVAHQYFYNAVSNNEAGEAWLDEGLVSFLTRKYLEKQSPEAVSGFRMLGVYPVKGLELMELQKIPVIFTLENIAYNRIADELKYYYSNNSTGSLSASSTVFQDANSYYATSYNRGSLLFASLEKLIGEKRLFRLISGYYKNYKWKKVSAQSLTAEVDAAGGKEVREIFSNLLKLNGPVDDKIESVFEYEGLVQINIKRTGDKSYPVYLTIGTELDTVRKVLTPDKQFISFQTKLKAPFKFAEIDEKRLNLFDENFANNSYTKEFQFKTVMAFLLRWFFWMQNLLVIFGGI